MRWAPPHYLSYAYSMTWSSGKCVQIDLILGEWTTIFSVQQVEYGTCIWQAWSKSCWIFWLFGKYAIVLSLVFLCHTQFERHGLWGSVWDGRNERFGVSQLLRHWKISSGTVLGGEKQTLTSQVDCPWIRGAMAIGCLGGTTGCFFISIQAISRMAVWKELLEGTRFGSADQPEHWAWTHRRCLMDSDALGYTVKRWAQGCVFGWDRRRWPRRRWP